MIFKNIFLEDIDEQVENSRCHANENQRKQSWGAFISAHKTGPNAKDLQCFYKKNAITALVKNSDVKLFGESILTYAYSILCFNMLVFLFRFFCF